MRIKSTSDFGKTWSVFWWKYSSTIAALLAIDFTSDRKDGMIWLLEYEGIGNGPIKSTPCGTGWC